jgi:hypothetical protein
MDKLFIDDNCNKYTSFVGEKLLKHVCTLERKSRGLKFYDYYFVDDFNYKYCLAINKDNCLESLLKHALANNDLIINGSFIIVKNDHTYYTSQKYGLDLSKK